MKTKKITWINGVKGICALFVFVHHYALRFYDTIYYGSESIQKTSSGIDVLLATEPYGVITNGNFYIILFITITGFIYSYKRFTKQHNKIPFLSIIINRYIQLLCMCLFGYVFFLFFDYIYSIINTHYTFIHTDNIVTLISKLFFFQWFDRFSYVIGIFWPMKYFFLGSLISYYVSQISNKKRWFSPYIYLLLGVAIKYIDAYFSAIFFGIALADIYFFDRFNLHSINNNKKSALFSALGVVLFILGMFLGGYPSYAEPTNKIYLLIQHFIIGGGHYYRSIASFITLLGIMISPIKKFFESKIPQLLGGISVEMFLTHSTVLTLFSGTIFHLIESQINHYGISFLLTFIPSLLFLIVTSYLYHKYISSFVAKITRTIQTRVSNIF